MEKKFLAGLQCFFSKFEDYVMHDTDYVIIVDDAEKDYKHTYDKANKIDYFYWKRNTPEWHVEFMLRERSFALDCARLLVPDVAKELNVTITQLKRLEPVIRRIVKEVGQAYEYYEIIYDAYVANDAFMLTDDQLKAAYESYKSSRRH